MRRSRVAETLSGSQQQKYWLVQRYLTEKKPNEWYSLPELDRLLPQGVPMCEFPLSWLRAMKQECTVASSQWALKEEDVGPEDADDAPGPANLGTDEGIDGLQNLPIPRPSSISLMRKRATFASEEELLASLASRASYADGVMGLAGRSMVHNEEAFNIVQSAVVARKARCCDVDARPRRDGLGKSASGGLSVGGAEEADSVGEVESTMDFPLWLKSSPIGFRYTTFDRTRNATNRREGLPTVVEVGTVYSIEVLRKPLPESDPDMEKQPRGGTVSSEENKMLSFHLDGVRKQRDVVKELAHCGVVVGIAQGNGGREIELSTNSVRLPAPGSVAMITLKPVRRCRSFFDITLSLQHPAASSAQDRPQLTKREEAAQCPIATEVPFQFHADNAAKRVLYHRPPGDVGQLKDIVSIYLQSNLDIEREEHPPMVDLLASAASTTQWQLYPSPLLQGSFRQLPPPTEDQLRALGREVFQPVEAHAGNPHLAKRRQEKLAQQKVAETKRKRTRQFRLRNRHMKSLGLDFSNPYVQQLPPGTVKLVPR